MAVKIMEDGKDIYISSKEYQWMQDMYKEYTAFAYNPSSFEEFVKRIKGLHSEQAKQMELFQYEGCGG